MERWINVVDYEGDYLVSDKGYIISNKFNNPKIMRFHYTYNGYLFVCLSKNGVYKTKMVHRIVYESFNGKTHLTIDHIKEGDKTDNRLCNLQALSIRDNTAKYFSSKKTSSAYMGVSKWKSKWKSQITVGKQRIYLGLYQTEIEAHNAYIDYKNKLLNNQTA